MGVDKQVVNKRRLVVKQYNAMATEEEQAFLKSSESEYGERLRMVTNLTDLVLKRTARILEGHGMTKLPKVLQPPNKRSAGVKRKAPTVSFFGEHQSMVLICVSSLLVVSWGYRRLSVSPNNRDPRIDRWRRNL